MSGAPDGGARARKAGGPFDLLAAGVARLGGGRPHVVVPLGRAMDRAGRGQAALLREKNPRRGRLTPEALRVLMLVLTVLGSVILSLAMLVNPPDMHPRPGVALLLVAHWLLVLNMVVSQAGPSLLVDDDFRVIGAWPVTRREILLARLTTILRPALEVTAALATVPVIVYLFTARPLILPALMLLAGVFVQAVGVACGVTFVLLLVLRWWGRRRAQRVAGLLADGNAALGIWVLLLFADRIVPFVKAHPHVLLALPPAWFVAWGDLAVPAPYWYVAVAGLAVSVAVAWAGLRIMTPRGEDETPAAPASRPGGFDPGRLLADALAPMMPGREGRVVRRLLAAHLREDWRFVAGLATYPLLLGLMFFALEPAIDAETGAEALRVSALVAVPNSHFIFIMAMQLIMVASYSSRPQALWIVALADLDGGRVLAAQRGMIRGLIMLPVSVLFAAKALHMGAPPTVALRDMLVVLAQLELIIVLLQSRQQIMPFSLAYTRDHSMRRVLLVLLYMAVAVGFALANYLYAEFTPVRWAMWGLLPVAIVLATRAIDRRLRGARLDMTEAVT